MDKDFNWAIFEIKTDRTIGKIIQSSAVRDFFT